METSGGRFEFVRQIGSGAYFDAFHAVDRMLRRSVFLKKSRVSQDAASVAIIAAHRRQWETLANLSVHGVPAVHDVFQENGSWVLITAWINRPSLRELDHSQSDHRDYFVLNLLERSLAVLRDLHAHGVIHGDISPGNILADWSDFASDVFLVDPAPALDLSDPADASRRLILGNPAFTAPEVLAGAPVNAGSDLFALGKVIIGAAELLHVVPPDLVLRLVAVRPADRPASAAEALELLRRERWSVSSFEADDEISRWDSDEREDGSDDFDALDGSPMESDAANDEADDGRMSFSIERHDDGTDGNTVVMSVPGPDEGGEADIADDIAADIAASERGSRASETSAISVPEASRADWSAISMAYSVPVPRPDERAPSVPADFSVVAPNAIQAGRNFVVEVWVAPSGERAAMLEQATRRGRMIERGGRAHINLERDTLITVILKLPDFEVAEPMETLGWNADIRNVGFIVKAPVALAPGIYPGAAKLMQGQIPFASIVFDLEVVATEMRTEQPPRPLNAHVQRIARAFASFANQDLPEVLRRVQGIQAAGINVFLDIVNLRSGQLWENVLYREIDTSDGFFLFWSRAAAQSPWVEREWRYALDRRGIDFINPLPLDDPRSVQPPSELSAKHFNDMLLTFIKAEDAYREMGAKKPA